jgi:sulfite exporter TauE/SafE
MDWFSNASYLGAFLVGLTGGIHCIGMCGGIVTALTPAVASSNHQQNDWQHFVILLGYNLGRITSYSLAGALVGGLGASVFSLAELNYSRQIMLLIAACFMLALGLYLAGVWQGITYLERYGKYLWRYIEPLSRPFIPATTLAKAVPLGFFWGWLPCAMVYTILAWAVSAGSAQQGALLMLAFGVGTLPNLLAMGYLATRLAALTRHPLVQKTVGLLLASIALWMLYNAAIVSDVSSV